MNATAAVALAALLLALPLASFAQEEEQQLSDAHQAALEELAQSWVNAMNMLEGAKENDEDAGRYGTIYIDNLKKAVDAANKAGLPKSTRFEIGGFPETTFGAVEKQLASMIAAGQKNLSDVKAADAAKRAPFAAVLSGDKLRIFDDVFGVSLVCSGKGGRTLYKPEEYAASPVWAKTTYNSNTVPPQWSVTVYRFSGMKLVSQERKTGFGSGAPSSAYE